MSLVLILVFLYLSIITFHLYRFVQDLLLRLSYFQFRTHQLFLNQQYSICYQQKKKNNIAPKLQCFFFFFSIFSSQDINETRRFNVIEKHKNHSPNHKQKNEFLFLLLLAARRSSILIFNPNINRKFRILRENLLNFRCQLIKHILGSILLSRFMKPQERKSFSNKKPQTNNSFENL